MKQDLENLPVNPQTAFQLREKAVKLLRSGKMDEGITILQNALSLEPKSPDILNTLGAALLQKGAKEEAGKYLLQALQIDPHHLKTLINYGSLLTKQGEFKEAIKCFERAITIEPSNSDALYNLGLSYSHQRVPDKAADCFLRAINAGLRTSNVYSILAKIMLDMKQDAASETYANEALTINPSDFIALSTLGDILRERKPDDAINFYLRAAIVNPRDQFIWYNLAALYEYTNRLDEAETTIAKGHTYFPLHAGLSLVAAKVARRRNDNARAIKILESALPEILDGQPQHTSILFELGRICDSLEDTGKAFDYFTRANRCQDQEESTKDIDTFAFPKLIETSRKTFTPSWVHNWRPLAASVDEASPVFLIGFPRSGTTLLDQILSSHPDIFVAEERSVLDTLQMYIEKTAKYPEFLAGADENQVTALKRLFYSQHHSDSKWTHKAVFVDKHPLNLVHCGLSHRLFPQAKYILALRHPCDAVLSCFMQQFRLNTAMVHFLDLADAARTYDQVFGLWRQCSALLPLNVHIVKYEDVVSDFRPTISNVLEFLELSWNDSVLEYDKTAKAKGLIGTPSYHQVTRKIYNSSSGRWLRYYEQMQTVLPILEPWIQTHGYSAKH